MRIGFVEPHLERFGGIRRILEFSNRLVARGHAVTIYLPEGVPLRCDWMPSAARLRHIPDGFNDVLDVLIFNHEPQWYLLDLFKNAHRRVFYALHYGASYGKEGSWEALRAPVDRILANSNWTADRIASEIGSRPTVLLGGINPEHFYPLDTVKRYPVLTVGDRRPWKGTQLVEEAARKLGLPLETYAGKNLSQSEMAAEYAAADVFVVGSLAEGFGQPGLEALACGTALVTTDNGGCREYAVHEETALLVPPDDVEATAAAIDRLRRDRDLACRLRDNGLQLVRDRFDWEANTSRLEEILDDVATSPAVEQRRQLPAAEPLLSVVVLAWDQIIYTQRCIETLRRHTDVSYELIVVDNGSAWDARHYAEMAGDVCVLNDTNAGFAAGMNGGLTAATGRYIAFCNNDTEFPAGWASKLIDAHGKFPDTGITVPAITEAKNGRTVRSEPGERVEVLDPFEAPPAAVVYLMEREIIEEIGGWSEEYPVASGEDVDLAFRVWVNDLEIVFDERVLVQHVGKGTAAVKLPNWRELWAANGEILLAKWTSPDLDVERLDRCPPERWERNLRTARASAGWMQRYFASRGGPTRSGRLGGRAVGVASALLSRPRIRAVAGRAWTTVSPILPNRMRTLLRAELGARIDRRLMK